MLLPMCLSNPTKAWKFALITTVGSVLGGIIGYLIGVYAFGFIEPYLYDWGYMPAYERAVMWFEEWGFWAIFIAGFSPIPYKVFTIAGGALLMPILPFIYGFNYRERRSVLLSCIICHYVWKAGR